MSDSKPSKKIVSRRDFLRVGSMGVVTLKMAEQAKALHPAPKPRSCIFIVMTGGPSQLETFDPKPDAPREIRGPLRAISTSVPGIRLSESLPGIAQRMDRLTVIRSLHHAEAPIHETGLQLLQTGRLSRRAIRYPAFGSVIKQIYGTSGKRESFVTIPGPLRDTGVNTWRGESAGFLGDEFAPLSSASLSGTTPGLSLPTEPERVQQRYGTHRMGKLLLQARQLVEQGVRVVTVNLFETLQDNLSWDAHAQGPHSPTTLQDYVEKLCPQFDQSYSALIDDLQERGLFDETVVVAAGEMGRTPRINPFGGRDHWTRNWSCLIAGDGIPRGQAVGKTDATSSEIVDRPVHPSEITSTLYHLLGVPQETLLSLDDGGEVPLIEAAPMPELLGTPAVSL